MRFSVPTADEHSFARNTDLVSLAFRLEKCREVDLQLNHDACTAVLKQAVYVEAWGQRPQIGVRAELRVCFLELWWERDASERQPCEYMEATQSSPPV